MDEQARFGGTLAAAFVLWPRREQTLSIHSIVTARREAFSWLAVLLTFALGTAAGDLVAEHLNVGYAGAALLFGGLIALVALVQRAGRVSAVLTFWIAYILTRPLGASIGDLLSQDRSDGGLGLGTAGTSAVFLGAILGVIVYLTLTRRDQLPAA